MAEIALIASIVQIADTGYRLSLKLYTSGEAISSADRAIITISKDISLTSTVLKELGEILGRDQDEKERICSENLVQTAGNTVKECLDVFEELDKMILKNMPNLSQGHKATRATMALEKLKWPFIQPRIQLLRGSLDMLRANISLMLNVLIYARHVSERKKSRAPAPDVYDEAGQKTLIKELFNSKEEHVRRFESLKLSNATSRSTQNMPDIGCRAAPAHTNRDVEPTQHSFESLSQAAFENAPAPQWPLPNIPASYPIESKEPLPDQSDQYNVLGLLRHFDILVDNLIREIYSPEYQIPGESRSRFTGAIRETHTLEVVEAERRESTWSVTPDGLAPQPLQWTQHPYAEEYLAEGEPESVSPEETHGMFARPPRSVPRKRQRIEHEDGWETAAADGLSSVDQMEDYLPQYSYPIVGKVGGSNISSNDIRWEAAIYPQIIQSCFSSGPSLQKADKNDVVDDLVRLWTLVR